MPTLPTGNAICASGDCGGQNPGEKTDPSLAEIRDDLAILRRHWPLLRLCDCSPHAERVLQVIEDRGRPSQVMLDADLGPEMNNVGCPWGGTCSEAQREASRMENPAELDRLVVLANRHPGIVFSAAVGNEAVVDWTDHAVPVPSMMACVRRVKAAVRQPVTVCENDVPWQHKLRDLVPELDFISLHTDPVREYKRIHEALDDTKDNLASVARLYPGKTIGITEAGWCTSSNGRGTHAGHAVQELQAIDCADRMAWTRAEGLLCCVFEAFAENWKGSPDPWEPGKHRGRFTADRRPKLVMQAQYPDLVPQPRAHSTESTA